MGGAFIVLGLLVMVAPFTIAGRLISRYGGGSVLILAACFVVAIALIFYGLS